MNRKVRGWVAPAAALVFAALLVLFRNELAAAWLSPGSVFFCALPSAESSVQEEPLLPEGESLLPEADEGVDDGVLIELLNVEKEEGIALSSEAPTVLIYHTHTTEAYLPAEDAPYEETTEWRTNDEQNNVVRVGEELARLLRERGIKVIHDTTDHEPPKLGTAYERSLATMERYQEEYPSLQLYIDLHRDAYILEGEPTLEDYAAIDDTATVNGKKCARLMFVVGTGEGKTGEGFSEKPDYAQNYALALAITEWLNALNPALTRPIRVKTGRYNQHVGRCLLVEVGHNANTLEEALNSMEFLADAIAQAAAAPADGN